MQPDTYPTDWNDDSPNLHGFAKNEKLRSYVVTMTVNGQQTYLGQFHTRKDAALAYDASLAMLCAWTPSRARPNNLEAFRALTEDADHCYRLVPLLSRIVGKAVQDGHAAGVNMGLARERRLAEIFSGKRFGTGGVAPSFRRSADKFRTLSSRAFALRHAILAELPHYVFQDEREHALKVRQLAREALSELEGLLTHLAVRSEKGWKDAVADSDVRADEADIAKEENTNPDQTPLK